MSYSEAGLVLEKDVSSRCSLGAGQACNPLVLDDERVLLPKLSCYSEFSSISTALSNPQLPGLTPPVKFDFC
jgi:hypothetical protein